MLLYLEGIGDWVKFTDTIHEGLAHFPETLSKYHIITEVT